jgi:hypothetical protein
MDHATNSIQIVDDIMGMTSDDWERKYHRKSSENKEMLMIRKFQTELRLRAK